AVQRAELQGVRHDDHRGGGVMAGTHTPGPWQVDVNGLSGYGDNGNTFNIILAGGSRYDDVIASLPGIFRLLDTDDRHSAAFLEEEANANLISAAPDLLTMLERCILDEK